jgi:hypothetical protein
MIGRKLVLVHNLGNGYEIDEQEDGSAAEQDQDGPVPHHPTLKQIS